MIQLLNIFILPFNSLPSLTLITHFFTLISGKKQIQYIEWKNLQGNGRGSYCMCCFFTLKHLEIIRGNWNEFSLSKITLFLC